jgi:hypothetical protein
MNNVIAQTSPNATIDPLLEARLVDCARAGHVAIESRLNELEDEWSRNRVQEIFVACTVLIGLAVACFVTLWGLVASALAGLLLLENALIKRSILDAVFKRFGWRTVADRERERSMLKAIRGEFSDLPAVVDEEDRLAVARFEDEGAVIDGPEVSVPVNHTAVREVIEIVQRHTSKG